MKKSGTSIAALVLFIGLLPLVGRANDELYVRLYEANAQWAKHREHLPAWQGHAAGLSHRQVLAVHLQLVLKALHQSPTNALDAQQRQRRSFLLGRLAEYTRLADCPVNLELPYTNPIFIDSRGRWCAVAHLMRCGGQQAWALEIARESNHAYVAQLDGPRLRQWANDWGMTVDELAWIQPGYIPVTRWTQLAASMDGKAPAQSLAAYNKNENYQNNTILRTMWGAWDSVLLRKQAKGFSDPFGSMDSLAQQRGLDYASLYDVQWYKGKLYALARLYSYAHEASDSFKVEDDRVHLLVREGNAWKTIRAFRHDQGMYCLQLFQDRLYMGGGQVRPFLLHPAKPRAFVYCYDGQQFQELKTQITGSVFQLVVDNGNLLAGYFYDPEELF